MKLMASTTSAMARAGGTQIQGMFWSVFAFVRQVDHVAPRGRRRLDAQAQEAERRLQQDRLRHVVRRGDAQRPEHVRQQVADA